MHTYVHTQYIQAYISAYTHSFIHSYIHTHTHIHTGIHMHIMQIRQTHLLNDQTVTFLDCKLPEIEVHDCHTRTHCVSAASPCHNLARAHPLTWISWWICLGHTYKYREETYKHINKRGPAKRLSAAHGCTHPASEHMRRWYRQVPKFWTH